MGWETRIGRMDSEECGFHGDTILLPKRMRGVLDPEEWRPIMASSLIYRKRLRRSQPWRLGLAILLAPALVIFGGAILYGTFGPERFPILSAVYLVLFVLPILVSLVTQAQKKLRLEADAEAARSIGSAAFLTVLRKIDGFRLEDVETTKTRRIFRHFSSKPDIAERIANLSILELPV